MATEPFLFGHMESSHTFSSINLALNQILLPMKILSSLCLILQLSMFKLQFRNHMQTKWFGQEEGLSLQVRGALMAMPFRDPLYQASLSPHSASWLLIFSDMNTFHFYKSL